MFGVGSCLSAFSQSPVSDAPAENAIRPMFIVQAGLSKFFHDYDVTFGTSVSAGIRYHEKYGIALNLQQYGFEMGSINYLPVSMELSYTATARRLRPFANLQVGHDFIKSTNISEAGELKITNKTVGGAYFSPGIGVLFPIRNQSGILLTVWYMNRGYKTSARYQFPGDDITNSYKGNRAGYRIGLGYKF